MIQRLQTVFLILAFISAILLIVVPIVDYKDIFTDNTIQVYTLFTKVNNDQIIYSPVNIILLGIIVILPIINIFLYKNRNVQIKLCYANLLVNLLLVMLLAYKIHNPIQDNYESWTVQIGAAIFSINIIFILLAKKFIIKDQQLIDSANRLR